MSGITYPYCCKYSPWRIYSIKSNSMDIFFGCSKVFLEEGVLVFLYSIVSGHPRSILFLGSPVTAYARLA